MYENTWKALKVEYNRETNKATWNGKKLIRLILSEGRNYTSVLQNYGFADNTSWVFILQIYVTNLSKGGIKGFQII
jgi:hypothetical protein